MTQLKVDGSLTAGPPTVTEGTFPSMIATVSLATIEDPKGYQRASGILRRTETFASFTDLGEPGNVVTQANFLYFKSSAAVEIRLTTDDGAGGDVVSIVPIQGLTIIEFDSLQFLKTLEMNGSATVEYFVSGNS